MYSDIVEWARLLRESAEGKDVKVNVLSGGRAIEVIRGAKYAFIWERSEPFDAKPFEYIDYVSEKFPEDPRREFFTRVHKPVFLNRALVQCALAEFTKA